MGIGQHELASMICGAPEKVQVRRKHNKAITIEWDIPIIVATNGLDKWTNPNGQMDRRMLIFPFDKAVDVGDTLLPTRLKKNLVGFLVLINSMYKSLVMTYSKQMIWSQSPNAPIIVGQRMLDAREDARRQMDLLYNFLSTCQTIEFDPLFTMSKSDFMRELDGWKLMSGLRSERWVFRKDTITCFKQFGLKYDSSYEDSRDGSKYEAILGCRQVNATMDE